MLCTGTQLCALPYLNPQTPHYLNLPRMCVTHNYTKTRASTGQTYGLTAPITLVKLAPFPFLVFWLFDLSFETGSHVAQPAPEFTMSLGMTSQVLGLQACITNWCHHFTKYTIRHPNRQVYLSTPVCPAPVADDTPPTTDWCQLAWLRDWGIGHNESAGCTERAYLDSSSAGWGRSSWEGLSTSTTLRWMPAHTELWLGFASEISQPARNSQNIRPQSSEASSNPSWALETHHSTRPM